MRGPAADPLCCSAGLDIDGLYRVSGNLAVIQKLRFKADHGNTPTLCVDFSLSSGAPCCVLTVSAPVQTEELDLEDGQWEDVHVITGALKLFFRELPEPLFPFSHFNKFITAIRESERTGTLLLQTRVCSSEPLPLLCFCRNP